MFGPTILTQNVRTRVLQINVITERNNSRNMLFFFCMILNNSETMTTD